MRTLLTHWRNFLSKRRMPKMINNYVGREGKPIKSTSISTATFIDYPQNLILGEKVFIGHFNFIEASNTIEIAEGCQITTYVSITTQSSHNSIRMYGKHYAGADMKAYVKGPIKIGAFTFIGPHSTLLPNTTIGKGCIISAYSYVKGNFPDFSIISGNPAVIVGDTRTKDNEFLNQNPELQTYYNEWANN
ncbi:MAG: acyltransferase [Fluviicola sp.]